MCYRGRKIGKKKLDFESNQIKMKSTLNWTRDPGLLNLFSYKIDKVMKSETFKRLKSGVSSHQKRNDIAHQGDRSFSV